MLDKPNRLGYSNPMMHTRHGNTANEIAIHPDWMKTGRKQYLHGSGAAVAYDCNRYGWKLTGAGRWDGLYKSLWVAKHWAEKAAAEAR